MPFCTFQNGIPQLHKIGRYSTDCWFLVYLQAIWCYISQNTLFGIFMMLMVQFLIANSFLALHNFSVVNPTTPQNTNTYDNQINFRPIHFMVIEKSFLKQLLTFVFFKIHHDILHYLYTKFACC